MSTIFIPGRRRLVAGVLGLMLLGPAGCAHLPTATPMPPEVTITAAGPIDRGAPFAWAPSGKRIALARGGLLLIAPTGVTEVRLSADSPAALAWSTDGSRLAAAFPQGGKTVLRLFDPVRGAVVAEAAVAGRVNALAWTGGDELLAAAMEVTGYSFGGNVRQYLYRWSGRAAPVATTLAEATIKPPTMRQQAGELQQLFHLAVSPAGDELLYTRLHDPPAFPPYLEVVIRHLATGAERKVAAVGLASGGALFAGDGDQVLYGDGQGVSRRLDPWRGRELAAYPTPGTRLAISPGGSYLLADGRLFRDGRQLAAFPVNSAGLFAPRGDRLLVRYGSTLFLVQGLAPDEAAIPGATGRERLLELRRWRSQGLISVDDYQAAKERVLDK